MNIKTTIGWIGLGRMGIPMSKRLMDEGYPVMVYNRTKGKEEAFTESLFSISSSPAEILKKNEVVVVMVSDDKAIQDIFTGPFGLLSTGVSGKIIINMSTISPDVSKEMALLCNKQGIHYLDAPVSGSVKQAETGTLVVMAGGEEDAFQKVRPILNHLSKLAIRVGANGAGNNAKLAVNTLLGIMSQGLAEVVLFAQQNGIQTEDLLNIINNSAMGNVYLKIKGDAILNDNFQAAFALKHIAKDLRLAKQSGLKSPLGTTILKTFQEAEAEYGEEDIIAVIKKLEKE
ncbi:MAG: NAD(P)-dependent oxidoreductase [Paludibacter sp.]|nr:NAD(P)-dependent oxidoreductase [Paludibacter sp.]